MRAAVLREQGPVTDRRLELTDIPAPEAEPDEVRLRVHACGICRTDLHVIEGDLEPRRLPVVPGHQVVGEVIAAAADGRGPAVGTRVGVAWLRRTCGSCRFCASGRENLCPHARFTGWTDDGGFAEEAVAPAAWVHALPDALDDVRAAPLLCAGIIGFRCLRCCDIDHWAGARLGLYGFGAAAHLAIQIALHRGAEVFVCTRDEKHRRLAAELGATWVGGTVDPPPRPLDASIIFAPAGEIVPPALRALDAGGVLVCGGIHMSTIPPIEYADLYRERRIRSVTNNTRDDAREFLAEAAQAGVSVHVERFDLEHVNDALIALKQDGLRGAGVIVVA